MMMMNTAPARGQRDDVMRLSFACCLLPLLLAGWPLLLLAGLDEQGEAPVKRREPPALPCWTWH